MEVKQREELGSGAKRGGGDGHWRCLNGGEDGSPASPAPAQARHASCCVPMPDEVAKWGRQAVNDGEQAHCLLPVTVHRLKPLLLRSCSLDSKCNSKNVLTSTCSSTRGLQLCS